MAGVGLQPRFRNMRPALAIVFFCLACSLARAQPAEDPDAVVKALFPKDDELPHWRLGEIAARLGLHAGSQVADVGCGSRITRRPPGFNASWNRASISGYFTSSW